MQKEKYTPDHPHVTSVSGWGKGGGEGKPKMTKYDGGAVGFDILETSQYFHALPEKKTQGVAQTTNNLFSIILVQRGKGNKTLVK